MRLYRCRWLLPRFDIAHMLLRPPDKPKEQIEGGNAYNTLFVSNMSYETDEDSLRREFDVYVCCHCCWRLLFLTCQLLCLFSYSYGPIVSLKIVRDQNGKSRGYAFVEYEAEADMKTAYKRADGRKVDGRRVNVDVERGRTVRGWLPRRLGENPVRRGCDVGAHVLTYPAVCGWGLCAGGGLGRGRPAKPSKEEIMYVAVAVWAGARVWCLTRHVCCPRRASIAQRTNKFVPSGYSAPRAYIGGGGPRLRVGGGSGGGGGYSRGGDDRGRDRSRGGDDRGRGSSRDHRGPSRSHRGDSSRDARPSRSRGRSRRPSSRSRSPVRRSRR